MIKDAIASLDPAPIHRDLIAEVNIVPVTSRLATAHLGIEKGLKALITDAGGNSKHGHDLNRLYRELRECDLDSADFLAEAFEDAVKCFRYDVNTKDFEHLRSLGDYLCNVGTRDVFDALRYWAMEESSKESPIPYISLSIHRELLCALRCLFLPNRRETVSDRVEREVTYAMFEGRRGISWSDGDTRKEQSVDWYGNWLFREHATCCSALEEAIQQNFAVTDDEFVTQALSDAYKDVQESEDPAVQYYIGTLTYLPEGSQRRNPEAIPEVKWSNQDQIRGTVVTPAGTPLGFIEKSADGAWGIIPSEDGLVQVTEIAIAEADAKDYLVNRLTRQVTVTVDGKSKQLRIVRDKDFFPLPSFSPPLWTTDTENSADLESDAATYKLEFWDGEHGLSPGDGILVKLQPEGSQAFASLLEGAVIEVAEQTVSITGTVNFKLTRAVES